eukprot:CAMPEP_0177787804 /NCGR_PEP_ID=MMETSP0491_2-20121128/21724_1 /TAXON_ID=63592 /ORGANISM="Tetraselmis chuii, Strain PLY429" /LENGTH=50 /DNA_ID=CAMNT_0019309251 /DNA_START=8 /DNA_END=160 /DNA_ORIENTATION=+
MAITLRCDKPSAKVWLRLSLAMLRLPQINAHPHFLGGIRQFASHESQPRN